MASYDTQSFDITHLIEQYRGKQLEELYQENHQIIKNKMGEFIELIWQEDGVFQGRRWCGLWE